MRIILKKIWEQLDNCLQLPSTTSAEILSLLTIEGEKKKVFLIFDGFEWWDLRHHKIEIIQ